jgi:hypothetical protein
VPDLQPEINVKQGDTDVPAGGRFDFGPAPACNPGPQITFTIENSGTAELLLTGVPPVQVNGTDAAMFSATVQPGSPIAAVGTTTFRMVFHPTAGGERKAEVTIQSNDTDESSYTFTAAGTGIPPEINVKQGGKYIPSGTGEYDFGRIYRGSCSAAVGFIIENIEEAALHLTGSPDRVEITGLDSTRFRVGTQPSSPVGRDQPAPFTISFCPTTVGEKTADVSIPNDDPDDGEAPYTFKIKGEGICGHLDPSFDPGSGVEGYDVNAIAAQPDGKILIGGGFDSYNGTPRKLIARLNSNGSLDTLFDPDAGADGAIRAMVLQSDGKVLIG